MLPGVILPVLLIFWAVAAAGIVAYGTHPNVIQLPHGLGMILLARRLEWPLFALSLLLVIALFALVISGKRRIFWLLGLAPVLALYYHRFHSDPINTFAIVENPSFVGVSEAGFLTDNDWVVGVRFNDATYAYPFSSIYLRPVVLQTDHDKKMALLWSPFANRALAFAVDHDVKARDLEIVSFPANATLLYNSRLGQFINAITGSTSAGQRPDGFHAPLSTFKTTWRVFRSFYPGGKVLNLPATYPNVPHSPVLPLYPVPRDWSQDSPTDSRIAVIETEKPLAVVSDAIPARPLNIVASGTPVMVYRDGQTGLLHAFDRRIESDLSPQFLATQDSNRPTVAFTDIDTQTGWTSAGVAVDGDPKLKGKRLMPVAVEDDLYWPVMKYWYPTLHLHPRERGQPDPLLYSVPGPASRATPAHPQNRTRRVR
jgi:hypothetical protein